MAESKGGTRMRPSKFTEGGGLIRAGLGGEAHR
jgi:hypothetical protein